MGWFENLKEFTGGVGKVIGTAGGVVGGTVVGALEAGYNKLNGMEDDDVMDKWGKTIDAGVEIGEDVGEGIGKFVPEIVATAAAGKVIHEAGKKVGTGGQPKKFIDGPSTEPDPAPTSNKRKNTWDNEKGW